MARGWKKRAEASVYGPRTEYVELLGKYANVFQVEVHAIERCAQFNLDKKYRNVEIAILSDSQAAIKALSSCVISSKLVWDCVGRLNVLAGCNMVTKGGSNPIRKT